MTFLLQKLSLCAVSRETSFCESTEANNDTYCVAEERGYAVNIADAAHVSAEEKPAMAVKIALGGLTWRL